MKPTFGVGVVSGDRRARKGERGIALVLTLLLLLLMTGMIVAMVASANSDMLINGYYRNFRASFYAADSGLSIVRQDMANQLLAQIPDTFPPSTQPIPTGSEATVLTTIANTWGSNSSIIAGVNQAWPASFSLDTTTTGGTPVPNLSLSLATCTVQGGQATATCLNPCPAACSTAATTPTSYTYLYNYHLLVYGQGQGTQKTTLEESGVLKIVAPLAAAANTTASFAAWGMFIGNNNICDGSTLVPGTISGPVFTNGSWNFGTSGQYVFTDAVGSHGANAGFQFSGSCDQKNAASDTKSGVTIAPTFAVAPKWGQATIPLPTNDYNQQRAVLDGVGTAGQPTNADRNANLRSNSGTVYPSGGASTGVFLPYKPDAAHPGQYLFTGGGIMVEGNATVTLSTSGSSQQVYQIVQGSTTTTITVDNTANTTVFASSPGSSVTINGVPTQRDPVTNAVINEATMLYVDGNITALKGPGEGLAAVQDNNALTITASGDVTITGDIRYKTEPVTLTQNQIPGTPADTLIPGNDVGQALGIFTATGNINLANTQSSGNLQIDASLATISQGGSGGLVNTGNAINKLTIVGGRIQNNIMNINTTTRNVFFDRRYAKGVAPPWFPSTTINNAGLEQSPATASFQRLQWVNQTSYQ